MAMVRIGFLAVRRGGLRMGFSSVSTSREAMRKELPTCRTGAVETDVETVEGHALGLGAEDQTGSAVGEVEFFGIAFLGSPVAVGLGPRSEIGVADRSGSGGTAGVRCINLKDQAEQQEQE